jgi:hypothetical protein
MQAVAAEQVRRRLMALAQREYDKIKQLGDQFVNQLYKYAQKAAEVLGEKHLGKLHMWAFADDSYRCPLLWHTAKSKDCAPGIIFLQDWHPYSEETRIFDTQVVYVATVQERNLATVLERNPGEYDATLDPLFGSKKWQKRFKDGWVATNAVWELRPPGPKVRYLGDQRHDAARKVWTLLIQDLLRCNRDLRVTLCGAWATYTTAREYLIKLGVVPTNIEQMSHPQVWTKKERQ